MFSLYLFPNPSDVSKPCTFDIRDTFVKYKIITFLPIRDRLTRFRGHLPVVCFCDETRSQGKVIVSCFLKHACWFYYALWSSHSPISNPPSWLLPLFFFNLAPFRLSSACLFKKVSSFYWGLDIKDKRWHMANSIQCAAWAWQAKKFEFGSGFALYVQ